MRGSDAPRGRSFPDDQGRRQRSRPLPTSRKAKIIRAFLILVFLAATAFSPGLSFAKDFKSMPSFELGGRWLFGYEEGAREIRINPGLAYGGTFTQIIDFEWARNMAVEVNYLHSTSRGERVDDETGDTVVFDLTADLSCLNIGYFFIGRKILPYISGGLGLAALKYEPESNEDKLWEQTLMLNLGGGTDWTLWEAEKSRGLDRVLLGARVRYEYIFIDKIFDSSLNALAITARAELRF